MTIIDKRIDGGKAFDWGRTSKDYAKYRDIYPQKFYEKILERNLCIKRQKVLDLGTGTGVLPRNMYQYGAEWTGDVVTACQCFCYFNHDIIAPKLAKILKENGRLLILYMAWLPYEDEIAGKSEELVLKYNPKWNGAGETKHPIYIPNSIYEYFEMVSHEEYMIKIPFTKESWNGRMKACRGIGASLSPNEIVEWEQEHLHLLEKIAPKNFEILHYGAIAELKVKC